ncbi:MAG: hypothetical protein ACOYNF_04220 [Rhodoferax sp.]
MFIKVHDEGKLDAIGLTQMGGRRVNKKVPRASLMLIPLNIKCIGIDNKGFTHIIVAVNLINNFYIGLHAKRHIKFNFPPAQEKLIIEIVHPGKETA